MERANEKALADFSASALVAETRACAPASDASLGRREAGVAGFLNDLFAGGTGHCAGDTVGSADHQCESYESFLHV